MSYEKEIQLLKTKRSQPSTDWQMAKIYDTAINAMELFDAGEIVYKADVIKAITNVWIQNTQNHTLAGFTNAIYNLPPAILKEPLMTGEFTDVTTQEDFQQKWLSYGPL